jgi:hypothetical protein
MTTATPTFTDDYTQEMHEGYQLDALASSMQQAARLVGHLARTIPENWDHPAELYDYMDILAAASLKAGSRIIEQREKAPPLGFDLESESADILVELAAINVFARAWGEPMSAAELSNPLLARGWWTSVATHAGHRLQKYANIGDEWEERMAAVRGGDEA